MDTVFLNGEWIHKDAARISPLDRGFLFADGVYEVIPVFAGKAVRLSEHVVRLERSLAAIRITNPYTLNEWQSIIETLITKNGGGNLAVYLQVTRGAPKKRDHGFPHDALQPTVFAMVSEIATPATEHLDEAKGAAAVTVDDIRWMRCDIKSVSLLPNILLRQQAIEQGAQEAILLRNGYVTEGAASNIFIVKDGVVKTPPRSHLILGGITRDVVIEIIKSHHQPFEECEISEAELHQADEIWSTASTKEILPITQLNRHPVGDGEVGPVWKAVAQWYLHVRRSLFTP